MLEALFLTPRRVSQVFLSTIQDIFTETPYKNHDFLPITFEFQKFCVQFILINTFSNTPSISMCCDGKVNVFPTLTLSHPHIHRYAQRHPNPQSHTHTCTHAYMHSQNTYSMTYCYGNNAPCLFCQTNSLCGYYSTHTYAHIHHMCVCIQTGHPTIACDAHSNFFPLCFVLPLNNSYQINFIEIPVQCDVSCKIVY